MSLEQDFEKLKERYEKLEQKVSIQKQTRIADLQSKIDELQIEVDRLTSENAELKSNKKDILKLEEENISLKLKIALFDKERNLKVHNERGAGRKNKFTDEQKNEINKYKNDGMTIRAIAKIYNCSTRTIDRILKESREKRK